MSRTVQRVCLIAALALPPLLGGCAGVLPGPAGAAPKTYLLAPDLPSGPASERPRAAGPTVLVSRPEDAAGYATRRMAYVEQDYRLDYYADHEWVDTPAVMIGALLVKALRASGAFASVSEDERGIASDLRLDTVIDALYQDFRTRPSQIRVELRVRLVDPDGRSILATRVFADAQPAASDDAYGGVVAANQVLARLLPRIADFAAETAARMRPSRPL